MADCTKTYLSSFFFSSFVLSKREWLHFYQPICVLGVFFSSLLKNTLAIYLLMTEKRLKIEKYTFWFLTVFFVNKTPLLIQKTSFKILLQSNL